MQLRKLSFVKGVQMDLQHTEGTIHFVNNKKVDMDALARAVKDAGFSLRYLKASIDMSNISNSGGQCFRIGNDVYISDKEMPKSGIVRFAFVGKKFGSGVKKNAPSTSCKGSGQVYQVQLAN